MPIQLTNLKLRFIVSAIAVLLGLMTLSGISHGEMDEVSIPMENAGKSGYQPE